MVMSSVEIARKLSMVEKDCQPLELQQEAKRLAVPRRRRKRPYSGERSRHQICRVFPRCENTRRHTARIEAGATSASRRLVENGHTSIAMGRAGGPSL